MKRLKVGIIGQGRSGRNIHRHLLEGYSQLAERFEVVAIADPIEERWVQEQNAVVPASPELKCYHDYKELLKNGKKQKLDLVINASRTPGHVPFSIEAMKLGFNVLCEKPAGATLADFDKAIAVSKKTGRFYNIYQQSRFRTLFRKAMEVIESGKLGRVNLVKICYNYFGRRWDWQTLLGYEAGNLRNTGPHPLDQALQFYGDADPEKIFCVMDRANAIGDAEDCIKLILAGKGHPTVDMEIFTTCAYNSMTYAVYGTQGSFEATQDKAHWKYYLPNEAPTIHLEKGTLEAAGRMPTYCGEKLFMHEENYDLANLVNLWADPWGIEYYSQLYDALTKGKKMDVTLEQVRRQMKVIDECIRQNPQIKKTISVEKFKG